MGWGGMFIEGMKARGGAGLGGLWWGAPISPPFNQKFIYKLFCL